jgi:hypothetical protein
MEAILLAKIEEITLHQIEQEQTIAVDQKRIAKLEEANAELAKLVAQK